MMHFARWLAPIYASSSPRNIAFSHMALEGALLGLMAENIAWLKFYPETPDLYRSGVRYVPELPQFDPKTEGEDWKTIPYVWSDGYGDCEDLACWRAAELWVRVGVRARPIVRQRQLPNGNFRAHVMVQYPNGQIEDPSAKLGMYDYSEALAS